MTTQQSAHKIGRLSTAFEMRLLEARLDNTIFRLGIAPSRPAARQLVSHKQL